MITERERLEQEGHELLRRARVIEHAEIAERNRPLIGKCFQRKWGDGRDRWDYLRILSAKGPHLIARHIALEITAEEELFHGTIGHDLKPTTADAWLKLMRDIHA